MLTFMEMKKEEKEKYRNVIVIAGNHKQFMDFIMELPAGDEKNYICADFASKIAGVRASKIIETGTFYERKDYNEIKQLAETRLF